MPLIYSLVARDHTSIVLAEYTSYSGNFNTVALEILQNLKNEESKFTVTCDGHTFNFLRNSGYIFLVVADEAFGREIPFAYLDRVSSEFLDQYGAQARAAQAHSLDRSFGQRLKHHMDYVTEHPEEVSKVASVQRKVNEVRGVMVENIERVLERGDRIELLVDKTDDLRSHAEQFQKQGRQLRNRMWWQNARTKIIIALIVLVLAVVIFLLACFTGGRNCVKGS